MQKNESKAARIEKQRARLKEELQRALEMDPVYTVGAAGFWLKRRPERAA